MAITRRELITGVAKASVPAVVVVTVGKEALRSETIPVPNAAVGLLYDATICIGCKACVSACAEANNTPPNAAVGLLRRIRAATRCTRRPPT